MDVLVGVVGLQVDELGDDEVGGLLVDLAAEEHDAVVEQAGVDVERALAAGGLLHDHGDQWHRASFGSVLMCNHELRTSTTVADAQPSELHITRTPQRGGDR